MAWNQKRKKKNINETVGWGFPSAIFPFEKKKKRKSKKTTFNSTNLAIKVIWKLYQTNVPTPVRKKKRKIERPLKKNKTTNFENRCKGLASI